ncbi:MAG: MarR family winged helix-turn-helix transcriptional regulator [Lachnospiraceae bacterium]
MEIMEKDADVNKELICNLRDLSHTMRQLYEGRGSQKRALILLGEAGGRMTQRELTARMGIQPGSASELIAKLINAGFVGRSVNVADKRTSFLVLTETGNLAASEAIRQRRLRHEEMFSCLEEREKNELIRLLEKLNRDWEKRYPDKGMMPHGEQHHQGHGTEAE